MIIRYAESGDNQSLVLSCAFQCALPGFRPLFLRSCSCGCARSHALGSLLLLCGQSAQGGVLDSVFICQCLCVKCRARRLTTETQFKLVRVAASAFSLGTALSRLSRA